MGLCFDSTFDANFNDLVNFIPRYSEIMNAIIV